MEASRTKTSAGDEGREQSAKGLLADSTLTLLCENPKGINSALAMPNPSRIRPAL
jgi:hypothetical protein